MLLFYINKTIKTIVLTNNLNSFIVPISLKNEHIFYINKNSTKISQSKKREIIVFNENLLCFK